MAVPRTGAASTIEPCETNQAASSSFSSRPAKTFQSGYLEGRESKCVREDLAEESRPPFEPRRSYLARCPTPLRYQIRLSKMPQT